MLTTMRWASRARLLDEHVAGSVDLGPIARMQHRGGIFFFDDRRAGDAVAGLQTIAVVNMASHQSASLGEKHLALGFAGVFAGGPAVFDVPCGWAANDADRRATNAHQLGWLVERSIAVDLAMQDAEGVVDGRQIERLARHVDRQLVRLPQEAQIE